MIKTSSTSVLNIDPQNQKATLLLVPDSAVVDLPKGYGTWSVGSIYQLGQEETPPLGAQLLRESLSNLLALPVDHLIIADQAKSPDQLINHWRKIWLSAIFDLHQLDTSLTPLEVINLALKLSQIRTDKFEIVDLSQTDITDSKLLADSSRVLGVNTVKLDLFIREKLADSHLTQEALSISILNATPHPGLAQEAARIVQNLGGNVIIINNTENYSQTSSVVVTDKSQSSDRQSSTYVRMSQIFAPRCLLDSCQLSDNRVQTSRAAITIVLGEDFYRHKHSRADMVKSSN